MLILGRRLRLAFLLIGFFAIIIFLLTGVRLSSQPRAQDVRKGYVIEINVSKLKDLIQMDPNLVIVDVRNPNEFKGPLRPIPGAINLSVKKLRAKPGLLPEDKTIVLVCKTGWRSYHIAEYLAEKGRIVYVLKGGLLAWYGKRKGSGNGPSKKGSGYHGEKGLEYDNEDYGC